jgi:para-nitrobenzyl esterase
LIHRENDVYAKRFCRNTPTYMLQRLVPIFLGLFLLWTPFLEAQEVTVSTEYGPVSGLITDNGRAFLGIPFAAPPVGPFRWKAPQPPRKWTSYNATMYGQSCMQQLGFGNQTLNLSISEDCLFLNVFTPANATSTSNLPVMVWIYGGAYVTGSSTFYPGDSLSKATNIVVVSINYRVGLLGFFAVDSLLVEANDRVNFGLLDQQFALQWVKRNIANFGGDPRKVTIFGESAGGSSVLMHLIMKESWPFYTGALLQSPGPWFGFLNTSQAVQFGTASMSSFRCPTSGPQQLRCLRDIPADQIIALTANSAAIPCLDAQLVDYPTNLVRTGQYNKHVPIVLGSNEVEGNLFVWIYAQGQMQISKELFMFILSLVFHDTQLEANVLTWYADVIAENNYWKALSQILGDYYISCGTRLLAQSASTASVPVWRYLFTHRTKLWAFTALNATHGAEIPYIFPNGIFGGTAFTPEEQQLSNEMMSYWATFAAKGTPNHPQQQSWPAYKVSQPHNTLVFDTPLGLVSSWDSKYCSKWKGMFSD